MEPSTTTTGTAVALPPVLLNKTSDKALLAAAGQVFLAHSHLDYMLKMLVKTLTGLPLKTIQDSLQRAGSAELRTLVIKLAKQNLKNANDVLEIRALMTQCERISSKRNDITHGIWAQQVEPSEPEFDGTGPDVIINNGTIVPAPTIQELNQMHDEIERLVNTIINARIFGFLAHAERKAKIEKSTDPIA